MADFRGNTKKSLSDFGQEETPSPTGVGTTTVRGATRMLVLTELERVGDSLQETGEQFKFAKENFSAPRGAQEFGLSLRTVRKDLPGAEEPVEQVLGWNYDDFTVTGVWDDRRAGSGYAEATRNQFEALVKRGNFVKYEFEQVSFTGIIKGFKTRYLRKDLQTYSFTISPHFRQLGETVRVDPHSARAVKTDPEQAVAVAREGLEEMKAAQDLARSISNARVQSLIKSSIFSDLNTIIDTVETYIQQAEGLVQSEILGPARNATTALNRGAQVMLSAKTAVASLLNQQKSIQASTFLVTDSVQNQLQFENWHRTLAGSARKFVVNSEQTRRDLALRAQPKPTQLHRVRQGESLYQISTKFYGTPFHWREILAANHLTSIVLAGGELLTIPEIRL